MFDQNSLNSVSDFIRVIGTDNSIIFLTEFIRNVADELSAQDAFDEVNSQLFHNIST